MFLGFVVCFPPKQIVNLAGPYACDLDAGRPSSSYAAKSVGALSEIGAVVLDHKFS